MESLQPYKDQNKLVTRSAFAAILQATATLTAQPDRSNSPFKHAAPIWSFTHAELTSTALLSTLCKKAYCL